MPPIGFSGARQRPSCVGRPLSFPDNREVYDHVYATFEYPGGRTATFSSIESNAFDDYYEMYFGTKGTLILLHERDALLFEEGSGRPGRRPSR